MKNGSLVTLLLAVVTLLAAANLAFVGFLYNGAVERLGRLEATNQETLQRVTRIETTYYRMLVDLNELKQLLRSK